MNDVDHTKRVEWDLITKGQPQIYSSGSGGSAAQEYDRQITHLKARLVDSELARADAEAIRQIMLDQAREIAHLQAENQQIAATSAYLDDALVKLAGPPVVQAPVVVK